MTMCALQTDVERHIYHIWTDSAGQARLALFTRRNSKTMNEAKNRKIRKMLTLKDTFTRHFHTPLSLSECGTEDGMYRAGRRLILGKRCSVVEVIGSVPFAPL
jgi:uncharacterized 2Fe-2S/4Fe-4S cluster protein (DUF4445 family)